MGRVTVDEFDVDKYLDAREPSFAREFGWPDIEGDESYTGEEGEGD
jgi:hypothetical protein